MQMAHPNALAIGIFDSGVGGLTVLQELSRCLPQERFVYFGDTARLPYGEKSGQEILRYSIENANYLMDCHAIKLLVVACNTAAAHSSKQLKSHCPIPVIDVVEAGARSIIQATKMQRIAVIGTRATIRSGIYEKEILKLLPEAIIISIACPLLVPLVEEHFLHHEATRLLVREYLTPLKSEQIDAILLGCTHYPLLRHLIEEELGPGVVVVDSSRSCAESVVSLLTEMQLNATIVDPTERYQFFVSDDPERFCRTAKNFLSEHVNIHIKVKTNG